MMNTEMAITTTGNSVCSNFLMPDMSSSDFSSEELAEEMEGLNLVLTRVKIPNGGLQFEIPSVDSDKPTFADTLEGVILYNHASCAYWPKTDDDDNEEDKTPLCSSMDGKIGIGTPGGTCATCSLNAFGSAEKGNGKACKNSRFLYLLRSGDYMPIQLNLPPTSIRPFQDFMNRAFALRRRAACGSVVQITLERKVNGKDTYSVANFRKLGDFEGEKLAQIRAYALQFKEQILATNKQRTDVRENQFEDICEVESPGELPMAAGVEPFCIDGDREALPA